MLSARQVGVGSLRHTDRRGRDTHPTDVCVYHDIIISREENCHKPSHTFLQTEILLNLE